MGVRRKWNFKSPGGGGEDGGNPTILEFYIEKSIFQN